MPVPVFAGEEDYAGVEIDLRKESDGLDRERIDVPVVDSFAEESNLFEHRKSRWGSRCRQRMQLFKGLDVVWNPRLLPLFESFADAGNFPFCATVGIPI